MMKIALVSQEFPSETARGGIGTQYWLKARGLASRGHQVFVVSRTRGSERTVSTGDGFTVIRIPGFEEQLPEMTEPVQWITHSSLVAAELERLNDEVNLDIVDFPEWGAEGFAWLLNRTPWKTVPTVVHLQGPAAMLAHSIDYPPRSSPFFDVAMHMEGMCLRLADSIFSSSECSAKWIRECYEITQAKIPVIHMGVERTFAPHADRVAEPVTIIFVGRIAENKGVLELVEAVGRVLTDVPDIRLRIIGQGDERMTKKVIENAERYGDFLELAGFVSREGLSDEYGRAHIFAAPSYFEGGPGFVYLEAMACGLPVIGCRGSGVDEVVTDGYNGFLVEPRSVDGLMVALRKLLADAALRARLGKNGIEFVKREADPEVCLDRLENFYTSVISDTRQRMAAGG